MTVTHESPEVIAAKLQHVMMLCDEGRPVTQAVRQVGLPKPTYYRWSRQYSGMSPEEIRWTRQLMAESRWPAATL